MLRGGGGGIDRTPRSHETRWLKPTRQAPRKKRSALKKQHRFTGQVKLHSILLRSSADRTAPKTVKLFLNREDLDFDTASDTQPTQTLELSRTSEVQDVPLKRALWNTTRSITLFFPDNFNDGDADDVTRFSFLGFKGDWMPLSREPINVTYEAAANPSDHTPVPGTRTGFGTGLGHDAEGY